MREICLWVEQPSANSRCIIPADERSFHPEFIPKVIRLFEITSAFATRLRFYLHKQGNVWSHVLRGDLPVDMPKPTRPDYNSKEKPTGLKSSTQTFKSIVRSDPETEPAADMIFQNLIAYHDLPGDMVTAEAHTTDAGAYRTSRVAQFWDEGLWTDSIVFHHQVFYNTRKLYLRSSPIQSAKKVEIMIVSHHHQGDFYSESHGFLEVSLERPHPSSVPMADPEYREVMDTRKVVHPHVHLSTTYEAHTIMFDKNDDIVSQIQAGDTICLHTVTPDGSYYHVKAARISVLGG